MKELFLKDYYNILCNGQYPKFLDKYIKTAAMQRLKYIGQFCGCDYGVYNPLFFFSRLDHSIAVALITWNFSKNKEETIAALLHDLGTPCFSHCIDYLMGDYDKQESSEQNLCDVIKASPELMKLLQEDGIDYNNFNDLSKYQILENQKPKLCADRLEGVLHTVLVWLHSHSLEQVKEVYSDLTVLKNEYNNSEIGFKNIDKAELFFEMVYKYSVELQSSSDKFVMQYIADCLKLLIENNFLTVSQLYTEKETDIVKLLESNIKFWHIFASSNEVNESDIKPNCYNVSIKAKNRFVIPMCKSYRLIDISKKSAALAINYLNYQSKYFAFIDGVENVSLREKEFIKEFKF